MNVETSLRAYLSALRAGDRRRAFRAIDGARAAGLTLSVIYLEVLQPAMREIGRLWQENQLSVAEEHLATAITLSVMLRITDDSTWSPPRPRSLIAACAEHERHEIGLRMLCDLLDQDGWETHYLGPTVPTESLVDMVRERNPDAVALSASISPHLPHVRDTIRAIRDATAPGTPLILLGGRPFLEQPALALRLGADLTASDAADAVAALTERLP
jgi:MerR family transcriptional regulator, light-induced transcriptional regulator